MSSRVTESTVAEATFQWLEGLGYVILPGLEIEPETPGLTLGEGHERFIVEVM